MKKIILIENKLQAIQYVKNISRYYGITPISFAFEAEKILQKSNIIFKKSEDYEDEIYKKDLNSWAMKKTWDIINKTNLKYRGISILDLFYYDIYLILSNSKKLSLILKKIIELEKPKEIVVFTSGLCNEKENIFLLLKEIYNRKMNAVKYRINLPTKKSMSLIINFLSYIQKKLTLLDIRASKNKVKIFTSGGGNYFRDVLVNLSKNKKNKIINFSDRFRKSFFIGNTYTSFYEFFGKESILQENFKEDITKFEKEIKEFSIFKKGKHRDIVENIIFLLKYKSISLLMNLEEFYDLLKKDEVDFVLLGEDDNPFSRGIEKLADKFNIKTFVFQHGLFMFDVSTFTSADYYFAFGNLSKKAIKKNSNTKTNVVSIGCPRYDSLNISSAKRNKKEIVYAMEITNERVMLPDTHLTIKRQKEILKKLFRVMKKFPDHKLILKIRPNWELRDIIPSVAQIENFNNYEIIEKTDNIKLLSDAKGVIINNSTMGLESCILGNPTISISYKNLDKVNAYKKFNGVDVVYSEKEIEKKIKNIINGKYLKISKKELEKHIFFDGQASQRAIKIIKKVMQK